MVFSSIFFLFVYLAGFLLLFYASPRFLRKPLLLLASLLFYFWGEDFLVWILLTSTGIDYFCGLLISGSLRPGVEPVKLVRKTPRTAVQKLGLTLSICSNLGFLGYFKYFNFFTDNAIRVIQAVGLENLVPGSIVEIALPLGISFYSFQSMSYTIDVYRGDVRATKNLINFAAYVTMFPQLVAGPIVRYRDVEKQLIAHRVRSDQVAMGIRRFIIGLAKKVLVANTVSTLADGVFSSIPSDGLSMVTSWAGVAAYTLQIYFDFSGYSDMAIGLGMMLGFRFLENFRHPYVSQSIQEFWRRWHISLSTWFRDYLYFPLGGSRGGAAKTYRNLLIVFVLCGLWHGAEWTFLIWGLFHGAFLIIERQSWFETLHQRSPRVLNHVYALFVTMIGWTLFRAESFGQIGKMLAAMFGANGFSSEAYPVAEYLTPDVMLAMVGGALFSIPLFPRAAAWFSARKSQWTLRPVVDVLENVAFMALFALCAILLSSGAANPFLYFRF